MSKNLAEISFQAGVDSQSARIAELEAEVKRLREENERLRIGPQRAAPKSLAAIKAERNQADAHADYGEDGT